VLPQIFDDENNASIGLVWHRNLTDQMLDAPASGTRDWIPSKTLESFIAFMSNPNRT
jgi:hypothetical protein